VSLAVTSSFNYENNASIIVYALQVSMNLMYLIDLSIIKIDSNNIFQIAQNNNIVLNQYPAE
jgi:hypothetical protein